MASVQARASASRVYPAGRAAVVFAVCEPELAGRRLTIEGRRIVAVPFDRFSLLLTYVAPEAYGPVELDRRRDDGVWQTGEARVYERAVERAGLHGGVLPVRFLTVVADAAQLETYVREHAVRWTRALARIGRRRECAVHLFAGPHASLASDEPYALRVARHASRSSRLPRLSAAPAVNDFARELWDRLASLALTVRSVGPRDRRGLLWSAALLLGDQDVPAIESALARAAPAGTALGVSAYLEGPRPPFSFA